MAKPKAGSTKPKDAEKAPPLRTIGFKATREWGEWAERFAKHQRTTLAGAIDRAMAKYAAAEGFSEPPPERIP